MSENKVPWRIFGVIEKLRMAKYEVPWRIFGVVERLTMSNNKVSCRIFGSKKVGLIERWRKLHS
jgi:hypothetical protein